MLQHEPRIMRNMPHVVLYFHLEDVCWCASDLDHEALSKVSKSLKVAQSSRCFLTIPMPMSTSGHGLGAREIILVWAKSTTDFRGKSGFNCYQALSHHLHLQE